MSLLILTRCTFKCAGKMDLIADLISTAAQCAPSCSTMCEIHVANRSGVSIALKSSYILQLEQKSCAAKHLYGKKNTLSETDL